MLASDDLQVAEGDVRLKELCDKYPSAMVGYVPAPADHPGWVLRLHAYSWGTWRKYSRMRRLADSR